MVFNLPFFRSEAQKIVAQARELNQQLERAKRRREELQTLAPPKIEIIAALDAWIDIQVALYEESFGKVLEPFATTPADLGKLTGNGFEHLKLLTVVPHIGLTGSADHIARNLAALFPDEHKARFRQLVAKLPLSDSGPRAAERQREIAELDAKIDELESELEQVIEETAAAGLKIDLGHSPRLKRSRRG